MSAPDRPRRPPARRKEGALECGALHSCNSPVTQSSVSRWEDRRSPPWGRASPGSSDRPSKTKPTCSRPPADPGLRRGLGTGARGLASRATHAAFRSTVCDGHFKMAGRCRSDRGARSSAVPASVLTPGKQRRCCLRPSADQLYSASVSSSTGHCTFVIPRSFVCQCRAAMIARTRRGGDAPAGWRARGWKTPGYAKGRRGQDQ